MSRQPTRQLSLQQPPKRTHSQQPRTQIRRQRSADDNRPHGSTPLIYHSISDQPLRSRREKTNWGSSDRPKVRIAWSSGDDSSKVEVIASRIGTSASKLGRSNVSASGSSSIIGSDKATILYSRQELAERLRLAWKQREANKSNIDIFLAHETTADDSRCESRLSTASCDPPKASESEKEGKETISFALPLSLSSSSSTDEAKEDVVDKEVKIIPDARAKRASFQSGTNLAFTGATQKNTFVSPVIKDAVGEKFERIDKLKDRPIAPPIDPKPKRTNSAPPLQRRMVPTTLGTLSGASSRPKVNIVIDTPKIGRPRDVYNTLRDVKIERRDLGKVNPVISPHGEDTSNFKGASISLSSQSGTPGDKPRSVTTKKRARSGKRRVDESGKKGELSKTNPDVVTMVSLVSDADSDSENESNSPRDDKLVRQLRSNLPTTPIIKSCSPLMMSTGTLAVSSGALDTSLMPRRVLKSVSFQQDSIDSEIHLRPKAEENKSPLQNEGLSKMMLQQAQIQQMIRGSPGLTEEIKTSWQSEISCSTVDIPLMVSPSSSNYWKESDEESPTLTDREKRCLIVPIGDPRDKKRKLVLQRAKSLPSRVLCEDSQSTLQIETKESSSATPEKQVDSSSFINRTGTAISLQASISKLIRGDNFQESSIDMEAVDVDVQVVEPHLRTTKEKECWHLYRRMCDKGVCVSFDTVLRGMLTPTEYRLRRREVA